MVILYQTKHKTLRQVINGGKEGHFMVKKKGLLHQEDVTVINLTAEPPNHEAEKKEQRQFNNSNW